MNRNITAEQSRMTDGLQVFRRAEESTENRTFRVAAYCRVSTNLKLQESSLETQMESFYQRISEHPGWELVGIYADKGISGTSAKGRVEFQRLMQDAADGKIDYIMAKSISRFARNTVDALSYTRQLKDMGVGVYFEEQSLDTLSATSEIFLTIHAAFAQEESHSFSENMKRGMRNRFALGTPKWSYTYGFRFDEEGWHVCEEEAEVVRLIYKLYVEGNSLPKIRAELEKRNIKPPLGAKKEGGRDVWWEHTLAGILHSEKYIGDAEMQKSYTVDCLTHKRVSNKNADIPKYYKKDHHERIVDDETWQLAQNIAAMRDRHGGSVQYPFYGFLKCPICGEDMVRVQLPTRGKETAWICSAKCELYAVKEKYIHKAVMKAYEKTKRTAPSEMVEYKFLYDNVESITFSTKGEGRKKTVNWNQLSVKWKWGETSTALIAYETPSDTPCTKLEVKDGWVYINGVQMTRVKHAAVCVERIQDFIKGTTVDKTGDLPMVLTPISQKKQA